MTGAPQSARDDAGWARPHPVEDSAHQVPKQAPGWVLHRAENQREMTGGGNFQIAPRFMLRRHRCLQRALGILALAAGVCGAGRWTAPSRPVLAQSSTSVPRLTFTKSLPGSTPEYMALCVDASGKATYEGRQLADAPNPRPLEISPPTTQRLFSMASSLGYFSSLNLESRHKVANLGLKTFSYEDGSKVNRVEFNYTENHTAQQLTELFERISSVEQYVAQLDYASKYDPLSLPQQLRQIQIELNEHGLLETELLVPTLEKIAGNPRLLHLAQSRAQEILKSIREAD